MADERDRRASVRDDAAAKSDIDAAIRDGPPQRRVVRGSPVSWPPMGDDQDFGSDLGAALGSVDGIEVVLRDIQCSSEGVVIRLYGRPSELTHRLDADHRAAFEEWAGLAVAAQERGERPPDPPPQPGELLSRLGLTLRDDVDTTYRWYSTQAAGSGTEWDAAWRFAPGPPPGARELTVAIGSADGRPHSRRL
jgi:hypothetical protein